MLKIHESFAPSGELVPVHLRCERGTLELVLADGVFPLPAGALSAVMRRFGAPIDPTAVSNEVARLELPDDDRIRHVRHLAGYDVIARDYLVYEPSEGEPQCALAATVAAALAHLGRAAARGA
jgi:hypothetical protein